MTDPLEKKFIPPIGAILLTVLSVVAWLIFIILYALVWSKGFNLFQNLIVTVASFLIMALLIAVVWMIWFFSNGKQYRWSGEGQMKTPNDFGKKELLNPGQRFGEVFAVVAILLILAFFLYHQTANTGFFTSEFGQWAMIAFYGAILLSIVPPLARALTGARHRVRPIEVVSNVFSIFAVLYLLTVFPFNFTHFSDAMPYAFRFAFSWITNDMAKFALGLVVLGSIISVVVNVVKFLTYSFQWDAFASRKSVNF